MTTIEYSSSSTMRVYVALADILPLELRPKASCAGLCYLVVEQHMQTGSYRVKAAALPQRLSDPRSHRVFTVFVEADELAQTLPYDRALRSIPTCDLRDLLEERARGSSGMDLLSAPGEEQLNGSAPALQAREPSREERAVLLPELFVSQQTVADAAEVVDAPPGGGSGKHLRLRMLQFIWIKAAMMMARRQMESAKWSLRRNLHTVYSQLHAYLCRVFEACHQTYRMFASARPAYVEDRQVGWYIQVRVPASLLAA
jgi:hypothetical protein